jgi:SAM-dependent methyltransferase
MSERNPSATPPTAPVLAPYEPTSRRELKLSQIVRRGAYRVWRRHLRRHAKFSCHAPVSILDVGCGPGYFLREARRWFPNSSITGLDYELALLDWVGIEGAELVQGSAETLPFADNSFEVLACLQVLEHLPCPDRAIAEIHRVLKPGGFACIATPNLGCWSAKVAGKKWHGYRDDHISLRSSADWARALRSGGFEILQEGTTLLSGMPLLRLPPFILFSWVPLYFKGHFPWHGGESYIAFCRKGLSN